MEKERLQRLLSRGFLLSQALEQWQSRAIWVISRADAHYPRRLKTRLREDAPAASGSFSTSHGKSRYTRAGNKVRKARKVWKSWPVYLCWSDAIALFCEIQHGVLRSYLAGFWWSRSGRFQGSM